MREHKKLRAFTLADDLVLEIYRVTSYFPKEENFCLTSQIRRAAISVASNIVEGCARESQKDYHRFLEIAYGSLCETNYQFELAVKLGFVSELAIPILNDKFLETRKVLGSLVCKMRSKAEED